MCVCSYLKKTVNDPDSHVHRLLQEPELEVDLNQPVDQDGPHVTGDLLTLQVVGFDVLLDLKPEFIVNHHSPSTWRPF